MPLLRINKGLIRLGFLFHFPPSFVNVLEVIMLILGVKFRGKRILVFEFGICILNCLLILSAKSNALSLMLKERN